GQVLRHSGVHVGGQRVAVTGPGEVEQFRRECEHLLAGFLLRFAHDRASAIVRSAAASPRTSNVVTSVSSHAASSSRILGAGPMSATSSTRLVGIAAAASFLFPAR